MFNDFFNLIFPKLCCGCNNALLKNEKIICTNCIVGLPKTGYHLEKDNPINKVFWGRVKIEMAASYYSFSKKSKVQNLLHHLKYRNNKEVGFVIGELYGHDLKEAIHFNGIDFIIPVPLHPKKLKKRGYNQSEWIAKGLSSSMVVPINLEALYRKVDSKTQTRKSRYNRWENVGEIFGVKNSHTVQNKNILLVDDVVTTGATLEGCAKVLAAYNCKIYIVTIAYA